MVMTKSEFQAQLLDIFQKIKATGEEVIVTEDEQPMFRVEPIEKKLTVDEAFAGLRESLILHEDPDTPTVDEWNEV